jgi:transcriptional regulator with XRE-family HTH domain
METNFTGTRIATARKAKNMSQAQLAQQLFISPQAVGKWERGESIPDIVTVVKLADVLGVDLNYFSERSFIEPGTRPGRIAGGTHGGRYAGEGASKAHP